LPVRAVKTDEVACGAGQRDRIVAADDRGLRRAEIDEAAGAVDDIPVASRVVKARGVVRSIGEIDVSRRSWRDIGVRGQRLVVVAARFGAEGVGLGPDRSAGKVQTPPAPAVVAPSSVAPS